MAEIFHIAQRQVWEATLDTGVPYTMSTLDLTLEQEGFIHCSSDEAQVEAVLRAFYADLDDLVLLAIDTERVTAPVRHEAVGKDVFPHIYGPLPLSAVIEVRPLPVNR